METGKGPETPAKTRSKTRFGNRWEKGRSGNPRGNYCGSKHRATLFAESLLSGECEGLVRKVIELAKAGDVGALRLCLERLLPPIKSRPISFKLPMLRTVSDALSAMTLIIDGAASGEILADEAQALTDMVTGLIEALRVNDLEERLAALEKAAENRGAGPQGARYDA
jgi:hypothetical protein